MEYDIIKVGENSFIISDAVKVFRFDTKGNLSSDSPPSKKAFRELAYIIPPVTVIASSFEEAVELFITFI